MTYCRHGFNPRHCQECWIAETRRLPATIEQLAQKCAAIIRTARDDGLTIDRGNSLDLVADQLTYSPLEDLKVALIVIGEY